MAVVTEQLPLQLDVPPPPAAPPVGPVLSADRQRTARRRRALAAGTHPATGLPLTVGPSLTCSGYVSLQRHGRFYKCDRAGVTRGPGTDVRAGWPACVRYQARP